MKHSRETYFELFLNFGTANATLEKEYKALSEDEKKTMCSLGEKLIKAAEKKGIDRTYYGRRELAIYSVMRAEGWDFKMPMDNLVEDEEYEENLDKITTDMAEYFCNELCRHPRYAMDEEELEESCAGCKMAEYVCRILNKYNQKDGPVES